MTVFVLLAACMLSGVSVMTLFSPFSREINEISRTSQVVLPTDVAADGEKVFSAMTSSGMVYQDGISQLVQTACVPEDTLLRFDTILVQPYAGSFTLYRDDEAIYSFPSDRDYIDMGRYTFFTVRTDSLRGSEIKLVTDTSDLNPIAGIRVYPIKLVTEYGVSQITSSYYLQASLFGGAGLVLSLISVFIYFQVRDRKARESITAFLLLSILNFISAFSLYPVGQSVFNEPFFWNTVNSFINSAFIFFYITFVMKVTDGAVMRKMTYYVLSLGSIVLFSVHTVLSMAGQRSSFYAGRVLLGFNVFCLSVILFGVISYLTHAKRNSYIVISTVILLLSEVINTVLAIFLEPGIWQAVSVSLLRLASVLLIVFRNASLYVSEQMNLIKETELARNAVLDPLSGCYTRRKYEELLSTPGPLVGRTIYIIFIDINGLKRINDCFGHKEGDRLIRYCGSMLQSFFPEGAEAFRIGGDEFCCIVPADGGSQLSIMIRNLKTHFSDSSPYASTLSAGGLSVVVKDEAGLRAAVEKADELMYRDKRGSSDATSLLLKARRVSDGH